MQPRLALIVAATMFACLNQTSAGDAKVSTSDVVWDSPSISAMGSMPLGNGSFGANVWSEDGRTIRIRLSHTDAWMTQKPEEEFSLSGAGAGYANHHRRYLLGKLGTLDLEFSDVGGEGFSQRLDLAHARTVVTVGDVTTRLWIDAHHPALHIQSSSPEAFELAVRIANDAEGNRFQSAVVRDNRLYRFRRNDQPPEDYTGQMQTLKELGADTGLWADPFTGRTMGYVVAAKNMMPTEGGVTALSAAKTFHIVVYADVSQSPTEQAWTKAVAQNLKAYQAQDAAACFAEHRRWWESFWNRTWVRNIETHGKHVPYGQKHTGAELAGFYHQQRYIQACAGRGGYPLKFNGSIFLPTMARHWGPDYWWWNSRYPYFAFLATGDFEMMRPMYRMWKQWLPRMRNYSQARFGHDGMYASEVMTFYGTLPGRGQDYYSGGTELIMMLRDHYLYTQDESLIAEYLPVMDNIVKWWDLHWRKTNEHGNRIIGPLEAVEGVRNAVNPPAKVAGMIRSLDFLLSLPDELTREDQRLAWRSFRDELPPLPIGMTEDGTRFLACGANPECEHYNYRTPSLFPIFPYGYFNVGARDHQLGVDSWKHWGEPTSGSYAGWQQYGLVTARLGLAETSAFELAHAMKDKNWDTSNTEKFRGLAWAHSIDGPMEQCGPNANLAKLSMMLLQNTGGDIHLFPAWPRQWDCEFRLRAFGNTVVEATLKDGVVQRIAVSPIERRQDIKLHQGLRYDMDEVETASAP